jgi:hypothetical protein
VPWATSYADIGMRQAGGIRRVLSDDDRDPCQWPFGALGGQMAPSRALI